MDELLVEEIQARFPDLIDATTEFRFGNGWFVLIFAFLEKVERNHWPVKLGACHESWGWLHIRFTHNDNQPLSLDDNFYSWVFLTEWKSYYICEECSQAGVARMELEHIRVLCDDCDFNHIQPRTQRDSKPGTEPEDWRVRRAAEAGIIDV